MKPWSGLTAETVSFAVVDVSFSYSVAGGVESWLRLCDDLHQLVDTICKSFGGVALPDHSGRYEFVYVFNRATSAVAAMVHLQMDALAENTYDGFTPSLRCAVLTGELPGRRQPQAESSLSLAVALKDLAHVHQILVSLSTRELARQNIEDDIDFRDMGLHRLQMMGSPQRIFQVVATGLPSEFPPLRSLESAYTNLPATQSSFVAREREMFEIAIRLRVERLLTVIGASGVGKSCIAHQVAHVLLHEYPDGVFTIDLGELTEPSFVLETIAAELPFVEISGADLAANLRQTLINKQILLILDNCDNIPAAVAAEVDFLFAGLKGTEVILTCRQPIGFSNESIFKLPPLDSGDQNADKEYRDSRALLLQRVRETLPGFVLAEEDLPSVKQICEILRGVPLALELAASKFRVLKPQEVLDQLNGLMDRSLSNRSDDIQLLVDRVFEWTYQTLPPSEQKVFRRLSVFSNGWYAESAAAVCSDHDLTLEQVVHCESLLVQKGLARRSRLGPHQYRDSLCQALWQYAYKLLKESGELLDMRARHLSWMKEVSSDAAETMSGPTQSQVLVKLNREKHNFRVAIEWCLNGAADFESAYQLILGFGPFWYRRGFFTEGKIWLERLLLSTEFERSEPRAKTLNFLGIFLTACGEEGEAITYLDHALDLAKTLNLGDLSASINSNLAVCYRGRKDLEKAAIAFANSADLFREQQNLTRLAVALNNLGGCLLELRRFTEARKTLDEALDVSNNLGNEWTLIMANFNRGLLEIEENSLDRAEPLLGFALSQWYRQNDLRGVAMSLKSMAVVADRLGQEERATVLLGASAAIRSQIHQNLPPIEHQGHEELIERLTKGLGPASFFRKWAEGSNFTPEAAVAYAVGSRTYAEAV